MLDVHQTRSAQTLSITDTHKCSVVKITDTGSCLGHDKHMRQYDGEGRHEEQSGSGRQADITNRAQRMIMMMTGMSGSRATLILLLVNFVTDPTDG